MIHAIEVSLDGESDSIFYIGNDLQEAEKVFMELVEKQPIKETYGWYALVTYPENVMIDFADFMLDENGKKEFKSVGKVYRGGEILPWSNDSFTGTSILRN